jgi:lysophospholipase L1-like esterase
MQLILERKNNRSFILVLLLTFALALAMPALAAKGGNGGGGGKPGGDGGGGGKGKTPPTRVEGAGDSIMRGYNASCTSNTGLFDFLCYGGGDQDENSFLDGNSGNVLSIVDRYVQIDRKATGSKAASASGSEMTDAGKNNFETQASAIVAAATQPVKVVVELGGNDLCNRSDGNFYSDETWQAAVDAGLQVLVDGLPSGSTVLLSSVPRVQDLRAVGIAKQTGNGSVNCESFWSTYGVCTVATTSTTYTAAIEERQQRYNEILSDRAGAFNGTNGVEVVAEYQGESVESVGTYLFTPEDMNGGDCFHPSIKGQNEVSRLLWNGLSSR